MSQRRNKRIVLNAVPTGELTLLDFRLEEVAAPLPEPGQVLLETVYLSIDPYMRLWMQPADSYYRPLEPGQLMVGGTVSRVVTSNHPDWQEGDWALCSSGWQTFALSDGSCLRSIDPTVSPPSTALGVLGMPGFTAYAGLRNIGRPTIGETVVVSAASGAVGSAVGQIARILGARAVGITSGAQKLAYVKDELDFDAVVDYRAVDFAEQLARSAPNGIDVYFENVGGHVWDAVLPLLNHFARVPLCGLLAQYNVQGPATGPDRLPGTMIQLMGKSVTLRGFIQSEFTAQTDDFLREARQWFADGRLRHREHIVQGLEQAPAALIGQLGRQNLGKVIVQVGPE